MRPLWVLVFILNLTAFASVPPPPSHFQLSHQGHLTCPNDEAIYLGWLNSNDGENYTLPIRVQLSQDGDLVHYIILSPIKESKPWNDAIFNTLQNFIFQRKEPCTTQCKDGLCDNYISLNIGKILPPKIKPPNMNFLPGYISNCRELWEDSTWLVTLHVSIMKDGFPDPKNISTFLWKKNPPKNKEKIISSILEYFITEAARHWEFTAGIGPDQNPISVQMFIYCGIKISHGTVVITNIVASEKFLTDTPDLFPGKTKFTLSNDF